MNFHDLSFQTLRHFETSKLSGIIKFPELIDSIQTGGDYLNTLNEARKAIADEGAYYKIKAAQKCFLPNSICFNKRHSDRLLCPTQIMYIDKDYMSSEAATQAKEELIEQHGNFILSTYQSYGGDGLGILVYVPGIRVSNWRNAYEAVCGHLGIDINTSKKSELDTGCKDIVRAHVFSYDPNIFVNIETLGINVSSVKDDDEPYKIFRPKRLPFVLNNEVRPEDCPDGEDFIIYPEKKEYYTIFYRNKAQIGERNYRMFAICRSLLLNNSTLFMNATDYIMRDALKFMQSHNKVQCFEPLPIDDLKRILNSSCKMLLNGKLRSRWKKEKYLFKKQGAIKSSADWKSIGQGISARNKKRKTVEYLCKAAQNYYEQYSNSPSQRELLKFIQSTGKKRCLSTIKTYWEQIKNSWCNSVPIMEGTSINDMCSISTAPDKIQLKVNLKEINPPLLIEDNVEGDFFKTNSNRIVAINSEPTPKLTEPTEKLPEELKVEFEIMFSDFKKLFEWYSSLSNEIKLVEKKFIEDGLPYRQVMEKLYLEDKMAKGVEKTAINWKY